jgi:hypothetical protein
LSSADAAMKAARRDTKAINGTRTSNFIIGSNQCEALNHDGVNAVAT